MGTYSDLVKPSEKVKDKPSWDLERVTSGMKQEKKKTRNQTSSKESKHEIMSTSKHVYVNDFLANKAFAPSSFRLPPEILEKFDEVYYLAKSKYKADFKRYSVVVAALAILFWDFEKRGEESDLYKLLIEKHSPRK